jgi:ATP-binding cassette subfamily B protein
VIQENLTGTRVVRAFGRQAYEMEKIDDKNEENRRKTLKVIRAFAGLWTSLDALCGLEIAAITIFGIVLCVGGSLSIGEFTAFTSYVFLFFWPIRGCGRVLNHFSRTRVAAGRIDEVFDAPEEEGLDSGEMPALDGDIRFEDVCFSYDTVPVLKNLTMTIPAGSTVAFLGGTGSASPPSPCCCSGFTTSRAGASPSAARTFAGSKRLTCEAGSASCFRSRFCIPKAS